MRRFFVDTFYWIALSNRRDQWHRRVQAFNRALGAYHFSTTDEVLAEFLTFCGEGTPHTRRQSALFARQVLADAHVTVLPQTHASFLDGLTLYESRLDKQYSLTDCISMQVMRREGLTDVLSNDHHFTQEGFHIVFTYYLMTKAAGKVKPIKRTRQGLTYFRYVASKKALTLFLYRTLFRA